MSYPDTKEQAKAVEKVAPIAAQRLRQYQTLCKTFEAQIAELQAQLNAAMQQLSAMALEKDALLTERDTLRQQITETPTEPQPDRLTELEARITALENVKV